MESQQGTNEGLCNPLFEAKLGGRMILPSAPAAEIALFVMAITSKLRSL
jgi:hypothetical protein